MNFLVSLLANCPVWLPCDEAGYPSSAQGALADWRERGGRLDDVARYAQQNGLGIGINLNRADILVAVAFPIDNKAAHRAFERFIEAYPTYAENSFGYTWCYYTPIGNVAPANVTTLFAKIASRTGFAPVSLSPIEGMNAPVSIVEAELIESWMKGDL